jgi:transcriptional regulator with XRE-family HTH domain
MVLGDRIARLRTAKGQSLQQVADAVGVSKAHIWEIERHRATNPSMDLVRRLADHFGVSIASLVGEEADSQSDPVLQRMFRQVSQLDPDDRDLLDGMMRALLNRKQAKP